MMRLEESDIDDSRDGARSNDGNHARKFKRQRQSLERAPERVGLQAQPGQSDRQATFAALARRLPSVCGGSRSCCLFGVERHRCRRRRGADLGVVSVPGAGLLLAAGLWSVYRLVNMPRFADFLIAVESEMAKVSWPTGGEVAPQFGRDHLPDLRAGGDPRRIRSVLVVRAPPSKDSSDQVFQTMSSTPDRSP
jgi:hypothetical protein